MLEFLGENRTPVMALDRAQDGGSPKQEAQLNPAYAEMARRRITGDCPMFAEVNAA